MSACHGASDTLATSIVPDEIGPAWRALCSELAPDSATKPLQDIVRVCIEQAGLRVETACREPEENNNRPVRISAVCRNLFSDESQAAHDALRGLLVVRGLGDSFRKWYPGSAPLDTASFRIHLFFRSIEGLFAPALLGDIALPPSGRRLFGPLSVERGLRFANVDGVQRRLLELVYCECCGDLFFAGMKGKRRDTSVLELLPIDPDLDGLPDSASSQLFEELSADTFGVFWPRETVPLVPSVGDWRRASLNPITGVVRLANNRVHPWDDPTEIHGYLYERSQNGQDRHRRTAADPGTCVPYACPSCGTSYEFRSKGYRLSPLRNFRTGFAKTTQLLATEVFEVLRKTARQPKLVSFSDSRQDAAKAALDIERRHHEDLARQILVESIKDVTSNRINAAELRIAIQAIKARILVAMEGDNGIPNNLLAENNRLRALLLSADDPSISLAEIVETLDDPSFQGLRPDRGVLRPYLRRFADLGVHPVDGTGVRKFSIGDEWIPRHEWYEFFQAEPSGIDWKDIPGQRADVDNVRRRIVGLCLE